MNLFPAYRQLLFQAPDLTILKVNWFGGRGRCGGCLLLAPGGRGFEDDQQRVLPAGAQR